MNRDPVIFDEPHGYYGPAVIHHGDRTFDVTAELHVRQEEHGRLSWSGTLTGQSPDAAGALYQLHREQFTLEVVDRSAQCAGIEVRLANNEPMQLRNRRHRTRPLPAAGRAMRNRDWLLWVAFISAAALAVLPIIIWLAK